MTNRVRRSNAEALRVLVGDRRTPRTGQTYWIIEDNVLIPVKVVSVSTNGTTVYATWHIRERGTQASRFFRRWRHDRYRWLMEGHSDDEHSLMSSNEAAEKMNGD